jgi:hypothetical protein
MHKEIPNQALTAEVARPYRQAEKRRPRCVSALSSKHNTDLILYPLS